MSYNGWQNWETWNMNLFISEGWDEQVNECDTVEEAAQMLSDFIYQEVDELHLSGVFLSFLTASMHEVDWREIAEAMWDEKQHRTCEECGDRLDEDEEGELCEDCEALIEEDEEVDRLDALDQEMMNQ